jgi:type IV pilus assembly protein PilM
VPALFDKVKTSAQPGGRPPAAVELTAEGTLAAASPGPGQAPVYAFAPLPPEALEAGIEHANLRAPQAVAEAIRSALDQVSPRTRSVTLVLPDTAVRVFVLDFDALPAKASEAISVIRFRLRKMIPFDAEHAGISYQVLSQSKGECKALTAVMPGPILAEYESAMRAAGYEAGAVLPSSLAALEMADSLEAVLAANLSDAAITTLITTGQDLLLYRTLDLPVNAGERVAEIRRSVAVATAYFEDKLGAPPRVLHYTGNRDAAEFAGWLGNGGHSLIEPTAIEPPTAELAVVELAERPLSGMLTPLGQQSIAGVAGALARGGVHAGATR